MLEKISHLGRVFRRKIDNTFSPGAPISAVRQSYERIEALRSIEAAFLFFEIAIVAATVINAPASEAVRVGSLAAKIIIPEVVSGIIASCIWGASAKEVIAGKLLTILGAVSSVAVALGIGLGLRKYNNISDIVTGGVVGVLAVVLNHIQWKMGTTIAQATLIAPDGYKEYRREREEIEFRKTILKEEQQARADIHMPLTVLGLTKLETGRTRPALPVEAAAIIAGFAAKRVEGKGYTLNLLESRALHSLSKKSASLASERVLVAAQR